MNGAQSTRSRVPVPPPSATMRAVWAALSIAVAAMACGRSPEPPPDVIRVGLIAPLSGPLHGILGSHAQLAAELATREIDDRGGVLVNGRRHRLVVLLEDDQDQPEKAVDAARKLIAQDKVAALIGPVLSRNALAVAAVAEHQRVPMITPTASHPEVIAGRRFVFRVIAGNTQLGQGLARFAYQDLEARTAAVIYDVTSAYNRDIAGIFDEAFEAAGGRLVASEPYTVGVRDFRPLLSRIRDAGPDVLLLPNYVDDVPVQARQAREIGITATFLGTETWHGSIYPQEEVFQDSYYLDSWHIDLANPAARSFVDAFRRFNAGQDPIGVSAMTYDAFGLLVAAIESENSFDAEAIRRGLAGIQDYPGTTGPISYRGGGAPKRSLVVLRIHEGRTSLYRQLMLP